MKRQRKILVAECRDFSSHAVDLLSQVGEVALEDLEREELLPRMKDVNVLWVRLRNMVDSHIITAASSLKYIVSPTTGLNHIDIECANQRGVNVLSLKNEFEFLRNIRASSEHTVALILSLIRNIPSSFMSVRQGHWLRDPFKGRELHEKTIGLVGFGRIGKLVAKYLNAFDCKILVNDPHYTPDDEYQYVENTPIKILLQSSDIVSLHVDLNEKTSKFFSYEYFSLMKPRSLFINTARGELLDERALLHFLDNGRLAGAALDVMCGEHALEGRGNDLISYAQENDNLLITPHTAGCTNESMEKTEIFMAKKLIDALNKEDS